jgi:hypothetical protein
MANTTQQDVRRERDYAVALTRLYTEGFNARDFESTRVLVSDDVEFRGPNGSTLRGRPALSEVMEAAAHLDLVVVRTALEELDDDNGVTRVVVPVRELSHGSELFRTIVFRLGDGAITSLETLGTD